MNNIIFVTPPDDVFVDSFRLLLVDLTRDQSKLISDALSKSNATESIVSYVWNTNDTIEWLIDKKHKSDLIIFNSESTHRELVGYLSAQKNSFYIGSLRSLGIINNKSIQDVSSCIDLFDSYINFYGKE